MRAVHAYIVDVRAAPTARHALELCGNTKHLRIEGVDRDGLSTKRRGSIRIIVREGSDFVRGTVRSEPMSSGRCYQDESSPDRPIPMAVCARSRQLIALDVDESQPVPKTAVLNPVKVLMGELLP